METQRVADIILNNFFLFVDIVVERKVLQKQHSKCRNTFDLSPERSTFFVVQYVVFMIVRTLL